MRVSDTDKADKWIVYGRGVLHLSVLIQTMRREGYELQVGQPQVIIKEIDGKKKTMLYLRHEGEQDNIQWHWTKENPQGLPEMKKIRVKGTDVWDDTDRQDFFEAYLNDAFIKKLGAQPKVAQEQAESNDDLPF